MTDSYINPFIRNSVDERVLKRAAELADEFAKTAAEYDRTGEFPYAHIDRLRQSGYLKLTVPLEYGGEGISLYSFLLAQERLAEGDGSTALAVGWHLGMMLGLGATRAWPEPIFEEICKGVVQNGYTINSCASEPQTGSPSRGGRPQTHAAEQPDGSWVINGHKTWSSLSPVLHWFLVTASIDGKEGIGEFLITRDTPGFEIMETWDSMGMRGTGSHDLLLKDVQVPASALIEYLQPGQKSARKKDASGWLLHIPACYLGIASAARKYALQFALSHRPNSLQGPISEVPHVQEQIGRMELELFTARSLLYSVAARWEEWMQSQRPMEPIAPQLAAAKTVGTNTALRVVDRAMRIVGGISLFRSQPMERYYRDVRAGLHNPPMDDSTYRMLTTQALLMAKLEAEKESSDRTLPSG